MANKALRAPPSYMTYAADDLARAVMVRAHSRPERVAREHGAGVLG